MVKVGIIGSGFGLYGLLPAFNSTPGCKVISICGEQSDRLISYCQSIGLERIYNDWEEMLEKERLDAIAIAVPPIIQYKIVKKAISKSLHIFAEKPLATTYKQAKELWDLAEKKKIIHVVDFEFPEIEEWHRTKELLDQQAFGKLERVFLNWDFLSYQIKNKIKSWKTDASKGGGALSFYFSHSLHYLEYFAGKISKFKSLLAYSKDNLNNGEVGVDLLLKFSKGISGYAHLYCNAFGLNRHQLIFICKKGTIVLENKESSWVNFIIKIYTDNKVQQLPTAEKKQKQQIGDERVKIVKKLTSRFINAVIQKKVVAPSFKEGVRVQQLIEKIRQEAKS